MTPGTEMAPPNELDALQILIVVLTYKRPHDLPDALSTLLEQSQGVQWETSVLVIDNDPAASAMRSAANFVSNPVRFVHEPIPGIAAARNRALAEGQQANLLIFVDDDERPSAHWLQTLVDTWIRTQPAAVVGPVVSTFAEDPDPWITAGEFFTRRRMPTGTQIEVAATNNLLLDLRQINDWGLRFDLRFGASGGSDTLFTRQIRQLGGTMIWCDEAVVIDVVPLSRMTRAWVLQRALRTGNSSSRAAIALRGQLGERLAERVRLTAWGTLRLVAGTARMLLGYLTGSLQHQAKGARTLARGAGMTGGAWGYTYHEYRRPKQQP